MDCRVALPVWVVCAAVLNGAKPSLREKPSENHLDADGELLVNGRIDLWKILG